MTTSILEESVYNQRFTSVSYIWFKMFGLSPWKAHNGMFRNVKVEDKMDKSKLSFWGSFYNVVLVIAILAINFYIMNSLSLINQKTPYTLETMTIKLSFLSMLCASVIPIIYIFQQKLVIDMNNRFDSIDGKLNSCSRYENINSNNNYLIFIVNLVLSTSILIVRGFYFESFNKVFIISWPYFFSSWLIVQYIMVLNMIKVRFTNINNSLLSLSTIEKISLCREKIDSDIWNIKRAYVELCEVSENIANFFGLPMLIAIIIFSIRSIFSLYYIILILIRIQDVDLRLYQYGLFILRNIVLFLVMTTDVTEIMKQNNKTARIINLLNDRFSLEENIKIKLTKFLNELWHLKVNFSACDIIRLDQSLLAAFTGTVASYLVIAVQFRISDETKQASNKKL